MSIVSVIVKCDTETQESQYELLKNDKVVGTDEVMSKEELGQLAFAVEYLNDKLTRAVNGETVTIERNKKSQWILKRKYINNNEAPKSGFDVL